MLASINHSVMTTAMPVPATFTCYCRIAICKDNTHHQYRQTFVHVPLLLCLLNCFLLITVPCPAIQSHECRNVIPSSTTFFDPLSLLISASLTIGLKYNIANA